MNQAIVELPEGACCAKCGYSIHALTVDRCPECGAAFDRSQILARLLKRRKKPFDKTAAAMLGPPPWWATGAAVIAAMIYLNDGQAPSVGSILLFAAAAAAFLLRIIDRIRVSSRYDLANAPKKRRFGINWIVLPIALAVASPTTGRNPVTLELEFAVSYFPMHALAKHTIATQTSPPDRWVGLCHAVYICPTWDGMNFRLAGRKQAGFAYTTTGQPPGCRPWAQWLGGGWYAFDED